MTVKARDFAFACVVRSREDLPTDFPLPDGVDFLLGVFLPMDRLSPDALWQAPARIIVLHDDWLMVVYHPSELVPPVVLPVNSLVVLEFGRLLLNCWVSMSASGETLFLPYRTRHQEDVEPFFAQLRDLFLPETAAKVLGVFGATSNPETGNGERKELSGRSSVQLRFSTPAVLRRVEGWSSDENWLPAQKLSATSESLVWITDRMGRSHDPYETVTRYGCLASLCGTRFTDYCPTAELVFEFAGGPKWRVEVPDGHTDAAYAFLDAFLSCGAWPVRSTRRREP
jgi:hypothetical protein